MKRLVAETILLVLGAAIAAAQDPGATSSLRLVSGTINGQSVTPGFPHIIVSPGDTITGSLVVTINSTYGAGSVMAMGLTPTWGAHSTSFVDLGGFGTPVTGLKRTVNVNLTAPGTPGVYNIIAAFRGEFTAAQVMSATSWVNPGPIWDNGDDVAGWTANTVAVANLKGTVKVNYLVSGNNPQYTPATAIQIIVGVPNDPTTTSTAHLVNGTINGQTLNLAQQTVNVSAGANISGSFTVRIDSAFGSPVAVGMTPTWGLHATSFVDLGGFDGSVTNLRKTVQVNLTAPTAPGTYYLVTAFNGEYDAAHVMSCTNWSGGDPVWDNGDDVAGWSSSAIEAAIADGTGPVYYSFGSGGSHLLNVPATAIRIVVK